jgi:formamidopyrimidine-DNA glycosylase
MMPELPDVEIFKQYLDSTSLHQKIDAGKVHSRRIVQGVSPSKLQGALQGDSFESTKRHGKYLFARFKRGA